MSTEIQKRDGAAIMERVIAVGDLAQLQPQERVTYYNAVCESVGLNPLTRPFEFIELNGKLTLYARRDATDQVRDRKKVNVNIVSRELVDQIYVVTAKATTADGRSDESIGAVPLVKEDGEWKTNQNGRRYFAGNGKMVPLAPDDRANAIMKAETKAKRRVTLSICGLGLLDETELETIPSDRKRNVDQTPPDNARNDVEETDEEQPDLMEDMVFMGAWHTTLKGRGWAPAEAETVLKAMLERDKRALSEVNLDGRRILLKKASDGKYDPWREALRAKEKKQQEQQGGETAKTEPARQPEGEKPTAKAPASPKEAEEEVKSYERFLDLAREAAGDNIDDELFERGIGQALTKVAKVGKSETTTKPWRVKHLEAIRAGAFDWQTGAINQVAASLA